MLFEMKSFFANPFEMGMEKKALASFNIDFKNTTN